jgi:hypothetical protein
VVRTPRLFAFSLVTLLCTLVGCKDSSTSSTPANPSTKPDMGPVIGPVAGAPAGKLDPTTLPVVLAIVPEDWTSHATAGGEFRFKAPADWKNVQKPDVPVLLHIDAQRSNLQLLVGDVGPGETIPGTVSQMTQEISSMVPGSNVVKTDYILAGDQPAARSVLQIGAGPQQRAQILLIVHKGAKAYTLNLTTTPQKLEALSQTMDQVIKSVEIK